jgi:dTDP-4-dehydrorhamnose 3,5-epimerase
MSKKLKKTDIVTKYSKVVTQQDYTPQGRIDGVEFVEIKNFASEDGAFCEMGRLDNKGNLEAIPDYKVEQISYSLMLPGSIKAWHLHFNQEDVWYVPPDDRLLVGLVDMRKFSETKEAKMRFVMGAGKSQLLYIPRGVAHGAANLGPKESRIIYFTNQKFSVEDTDERRLPWDTFGDDFWKYKYE